MERITAWILTIGNEIVNGVITDTNREVIARELRSSGIKVRGMSSVRDEVNDIAQALEKTTQLATVTIVSGGLGPTEDDKTAAGAAAFLGTDLELFPEQLKAIEDRFKQWRRPMAESNKKQAMLPKNSIPIANNWGTAPGFVIEKNGGIALFFPGIPREMINMLTTFGIPHILQVFGQPEGVNGSKTICVYGLSESKLGEILADIAVDEPYYHLAFLPRFPIIRLRMDAFGESAEDVDAILNGKAKIIRGRIGDNVISYDGKAMESVVLDLLDKVKLTMTAAESITGGMIGEMLTRIPGSSANFAGSIVSYSNLLKREVLGVQESTLIQHGAVSHLCAREMADGAKKVGKSDIGLSITGIAGPDGGSEEKPVGTFYVGLATPDKTVSRGFFLPGNRDWIRTLAAMQSLDTLRRHLLNLELHGSKDPNGS